MRTEQREDQEDKYLDVLSECHNQDTNKDLSRQVFMWHGEARLSTLLGTTHDGDDDVILK